MADPIQTVGDTLKDVFFAGVGALSFGADKSKELINNLVKQGAITAEQGKEFGQQILDKGAQVNKDLVNKGKSTLSDVHSAALSAYLGSLSSEDRKEFVKTVQDLASEADKKDEEKAAEATEDAPEAADQAEETEKTSEKAAEDVIDGDVEIATVQEATE